MDLKNKVVIVTGSLSGIGFAIANKFLEKGAKVVFSDVNEKDIPEIVLDSENAVFIKCDVSSSSEVNSLVEKCVVKFGSLDVFINNAGIATMADITLMTDNDWKKVIDINLTGVFYGNRAAAKYMKDNEIKGCIINMSSILGINGFNGAVSYCAAKGGVNQITRTAALELAPFGIRVNAIAPGFIKTKMTEEILKNDTYRNFLESSTPLGYIGEPDDIANAAIYLASNGAKYVTGNILYVDGGWTAK